MYKYFTLQRLTWLLLIIFGLTIVIAFILNSQKVSSEHADFNFLLKHVVFVTDETWETNLNIEGDLLLTSGSVCGVNKKLDSVGEISGFKLLDKLPGNATVALTYDQGIFRTEIGQKKGDVSVKTECDFPKLRAEIKNDQISNRVFLNEKFKFKNKLSPKDNTQSLSVNDDISKLWSVFTPVIINKLSFFDSFEEVSTAKPLESKSQRAIREVGNIIQGKIYLPFYEKTIIIEEGQSIRLDIERAHILKLSLTDEGIEMRGVAELKAINRPDYSYLSGNESSEKDEILLPTRLDYIFHSRWFNLLSLILGAFIAVFGLFELYGLRTSLDDEN